MPQVSSFYRRFCAGFTGLGTLAACMASQPAKAPDPQDAASSSGELVESVSVQVITGQDDLRADSKVDLVLEYFDRSSDNMRNAVVRLNAPPAGLAPRSKQATTIQLPAIMIPLGDVRQLSIRFSPGGKAMSSDRWQIDGLIVGWLGRGAKGKAARGTLFSRSAHPIHTFGADASAATWTTGQFDSFRPR